LTHIASSAFSFASATFFSVAPRLVLLRLLAMRFVFPAYVESEKARNVAIEGVSTRY
jgi:hypothetical protein